jgi:hypothetical protein
MKYVILLANTKSKRNFEENHFSLFFWILYGIFYFFIANLRIGWKALNIWTEA